MVNTSMPKNNVIIIIIITSSFIYFSLLCAKYLRFGTHKRTDGELILSNIIVLLKIFLKDLS